jgi:hypothetical protein
MTAPERLMACRALATIPSPARSLHLVSNSQDDQDLRDTLPPSPESEPPTSISLLPSDTLKKMTGFDPDLFLHAALLAAADGAHESREARKHAVDPEVLIARVKTEFETIVTAGYEMIRGPVAETLAEVKALAPRVKATEDGIAALWAEFAQLKARMTELERKIEKEGTNAAGPAAPKAE